MGIWKCRSFCVQSFERGLSSMGESVQRGWNERDHSYCKTSRWILSLAIKYTDYSVKNSSWKNGKGDLVRELSEACKEYGLKLGIYLSPWDRNHPQYGKPEYITYFRNQLRELLTNYGDVFEIWFDGANGGTGYYGGANEERNVDRKTYYDWPNTYKMIYEIQPNAMLFSDAGPDCRWCGNEEGWVGETNWSTLRRDEVWPGSPNYEQLRYGHEDGTHWLPAR